jgi:two-component system LytT family response regulator
VTAYSEHAIKAFEAQAIDYLMKPVEPERLADTMDRVRSRLSEKRTSEELDRLRTVINEVAPDAADNLGSVEDDLASTRFEKLINVKDRGQIFRVEVASIERIDAAGDYMCIYTADNSLILRETMKDLEKRLDPRTFQRVHRSTIVNLESGAQVKVSRSYRDVVARFVH